MGTTEKPLPFARETQSTAMPYTMALSIVFLIILCLSYAINAADRQIFPTLIPAIRKAFGYSLPVAGLMATVFTLGLAFSGIPTGYLLDRTSRKSIIVLGMLIYSLFTLATIYATGFWDMLLYRTITGVGEGMQMAALFAAIGSYFHHRRSFYIGWMILAYGVGGFLGPRIGAKLAAAAGNWHVPFVWFAITGIVLCAVVSIFVPKGFSESKGPGVSATAVDQAAVAHVPEALWNRNVVLGFIAAVVTGFSLYGFLSVYMLYLQGVLKYTQMDAAAAFSFFGLGGFCSFIGGWCGDRFPQRGVIAVAFGAMAAVGYSMYNVAVAFNAQALLCFLTGALASGFLFVNILSMLQRSVRPQMVGRASGIFLTSLFGAASVAGYLMGWLVVHLSWGGAALVELTLLPVAGIIAMLLVNPGQLIVVKPKKA
jgi:MFS family permease